MKKSQQIERLQQVVRVLEKLPRNKKFDLSVWMKCGTVGCAIGWAASDPWFTRRGLHLIRADTSGIFYQPVYKGEVESYAIVEFFGLSLCDAKQLFYPGRYEYERMSKRDVIARIKKFIEWETKK